MTMALKRSPDAGRSDGAQSRWRVRLISALLAALAAGLIVFWVLKFSTSGTAQVAPVVQAPAVQVDARAVATALGADALPATPKAAAAASRYVLLGVYAGQQSGAGAAIIAVAGQPAKAYKVGAEVEDGLLLQSLSAREARLGASLQGPASTVLQLSEPGKR